MSNDLPKPPQFVGGASPGVIDPNLKNLATQKAQIEARNAERRASAPRGPNLAEAQATYDPKRDGGQTLGSIASTQQALKDLGSAPTTGVKLSDVTTKGLEDLAQKAAQARTAAPAGAPAPETPTFVPAEPEAPAAGRPARSAMADMDDFELDRLFRFAADSSQDIINNPKEREAIDKRVEPIDIVEGITTGEFRQRVPIVPGTFEVLYRASTPEEDHAIRMLILQMTSKDPKLVAVESHLFQLLTLVAGLVQINTQPLPAHYIRENFMITVEPTVLEQKLRYLLSYPLPMVHSLSTHQWWFDQRVRKAFTGADLGNG